MFVHGSSKNEAGILPNSVMEHKPIQSAYTERATVHKIWFSQFNEVLAGFKKETLIGAT